MKYCQSKVSKDEYSIAKPNPCHKHKLSRIEYCDATIHRISSGYTNITTFVCETSVTTWETVFYFFGAKTKQIDTSMSDPPPSTICIDWVHSKHANEIGDLEIVDNKVWSTNNVAVPVYSWPHGNSGSVKNAILTQSMIYYDHVARTLVGPFTSISSCDVRKGFCTIGSQTLIWNINPLIDCPIYDNTQDIIAFHYNTSNHIFRIELQNLQISLHHWQICGADYNKCFNGRTFCTNSNLLFHAENCSSVSERLYKRSDITIVKSRNSRRNKIPVELIGYLQESEDTMSEVIGNLTSDIQLLECQLTNSISTIYSILGNQFPSEILSAIMGGSRNAITQGDIISELACDTVTAEILPTLIHNHTFCSRPLVRFVDRNDQSVIGQIHTDGAIYKDISFIEEFVPGRILTFRIGKNFYTFSNYSLYQARAEVKTLTPSLQPITDSYTPHDYLTAFANLPKTRFGFADINSMLIELNDAKIIKNSLLRHYGQTNVHDFSESSQLHFSGNMFSSGRIMGYLTSPLRVGLYNLSIHLAMFWAYVLTFLALKYLIDLLRKHKDKFRISTILVRDTLSSRLHRCEPNNDDTTTPREVSNPIESNRSYPSLE